MCSKLLPLTLVVFISFASLSFCLAQKKDFYKGYVVTNLGDTLSGQIRDRKSTPPKLYKRIRFISDNGRRRKYGPDQILAYQSGGSTYHSVWFDGKRFLKVVEAGPITYYKKESIDDNSTLFETKLLKRSNEERFITVIFIGFRKKMMKYFSDCPDLVQRIDTKEFRFNNLAEAVRYYNYQCHPGGLTSQTK